MEKHPECDKCLKPAPNPIPSGAMRYCADADCECHTAHQSSQSRGEPIDKIDGHSFVFKMERWEESFDAEFPYPIRMIERGGDVDTADRENAVPVKDQLKAFISKLLSDRETKDFEKIFAFARSKGFAAGATAERKKMEKALSDYFRGLIYIPDAPSTYISLCKALFSTPPTE